MPVPVDDLLKRIDALIARYAEAGDGVGECRYLSLKNLDAMLRQRGYQRNDEMKVAGCQMPFIFQELNYDDYDWSNRDSPLGPLEEIVEIDVIAWSGGRQRAELTDCEYEQYLDCCHKAIELRRRKS